MLILKQTDEFRGWLNGLDNQTKAKVLLRVRRLGLGNPGDVAPIGDGLSEMRIHSGPGHRVYYKQRGNTATLLYGGGKGSQSADIRKAKTIARELED
jgi:putative addiction module killer protein